MKLFVINGKRKIVCLLVLAGICLLMALTAFHEDMAGVFASKREIPVYSVETDENLAALTFDCAWGADDIPQILDTLKKVDVRATFFMVGQWAEKNPEMVRAMADEGHDVANHSYSHFRMGSLNRDMQGSEIKKCGDVLERLTGKKCDLFRAPYGDYSNSLIQEARKLGYFTIQWDVDSLDWKPGISREEIKQRIRSRVRKGSIILFHNDTRHTAKLLPEIIEELQSGGYKLVPVSELILRDGYIIDHEGRQKKST
ncbi:MAG: polysaccharide deacetylase family protein [Clostridiaceae bacterium]|jgi:polysaccharide deacetylase family sporulation protein PdaB|nr:polysaccharide deacetylase family protein [Clostridiaceae bacterium]